jgi:hypothetical protein
MTVPSFLNLGWVCQIKGDRDKSQVTSLKQHQRKRIEKRIKDEGKRKKEKG